MLGLAAAAEEEEEGGREEAMACRFMCCLCLCKQSAGKGRTCSRLTLEMQLPPIYLCHHHSDQSMNIVILYYVLC